MASISSAGVGSGLDIESIISKLMSVERQPITTLQTRETALKSDISAYGTIKGLMSTLQTAAQALATPTKFAGVKTTSSDEKVLTAAAASTAANGSYEIEVSQLAQAQRLSKGGFASTSSTVGTGTLTIELGSYSGTAFTANPDKSPKSITIDSSNNTLAGIRNAINSAQAGVTATIVNGSGGPQLFIAANDSGEANAMRISQSGGDGGLAAIAFDNGLTAGGMSESRAAKDALLKVNGVDIASSTNTVTSAVSGVTFNLKTTNVGSPVTLDLTPDADGTKTKVDAFVKAYNDLNASLRKNTAYDATTKAAGTLNGESAVRGVQQKLRDAFQNVASLGGFNSIADIGMTFGADGSLAVDATKFAAAMADPNKSVSKVFAKTNGVDGLASLIDSRINDMLGSDGLVAARIEGLNARVKALDDRQAALESRMTAIEARYRKQFSALDSLVSSMNATSSYLTQQLASLSNSTKSN